MKILVLTPYSPSPPNSGGRMRIWHELHHLGQRHEITLVAFYQTAQEVEVQAALKNFCARVFLVERPLHPNETDMAQLRTLDKLFEWYTTPEMTRVLEPLQQEQFDVVILHHIFMAHYAHWFHAPAVLVEHNIESEIFRQHARLTPRGTPEYTFRQTRWMLLKGYENEAWQSFPLRIVTSELDKQMMDVRVTTGKTLVVENGIAADEMQWSKPARTRTLVFMGSLDFFPNMDALFYLRESILPVLWELEPSVRVMIAGRRPPGAVRAFAADARIQVIPNPEDMDALVRDCAVSVVPIRLGSGTRLKILHALALGLPVVTTSKGVEGLDLENGVHLLVRDDPRTFAQAILQVMSDAALASRLSASGRARVETAYDWSRILPSYEAELEALCHVQPTN